MSSLTILIPTLRERHRHLKRLQDIIVPQVHRFSDRVQIVYNDAGRHMNIGDKRNRMLSGVISEYFVFIDDDDIITKSYLKLIMQAIDQNPDCVTFNGWMTTDGRNEKDFVIRLGEKYEERNGVYYRFPNHLAPMRTELVKHVKFPHLVSGEDYGWAKKIHDAKILKTSVHIEEKIYHYDYRTRK